GANHDRDRIPLAAEARPARRIYRARQSHERIGADHAGLYFAQGLLRRRRRASGRRRVRACRGTARLADQSEHRAAQKLAREKYYTEYHIQVCTLDRESKFKLPEQAKAQT